MRRLKNEPMELTAVHAGKIKLVLARMYVPTLLL